MLNFRRFSKFPRQQSAFAFLLFVDETLMLAELLNTFNLGVHDVQETAVFPGLEDKIRSPLLHRFHRQLNVTPGRHRNNWQGFIYGADAPDGSYRVLVDRLWPRGISKGRAALDEWAKDLAPASKLRRWYGHNPARFEEFARRYRVELRGRRAVEAIGRLRTIARDNRITLLTATGDLERSGARVLLDVLREMG